MLLMIDNYDSFTYNLVQYLEELGSDVCVVRNDCISLEQLGDMAPDLIVISPGPCTPDEAGISVDLVRAFSGTVPILGVCLGHQSIASAFGGRIVHADSVMHGKPSMIYHDGRGIFEGLPKPLTATRYHSLIVERESLPECLECSAWTVDEHGRMDEIMGFRHREHPTTGLQFHPESILTEFGHDLLKNFLHQATRGQFGAQWAANSG